MSGQIATLRAITEVPTLSPAQKTRALARAAENLLPYPALASDEGLAQDETRVIQETALPASGM
ncbi:MAG: hypothetical protein Q8Q26_04630 [Pseudorhodobacter sp.]|nr:hypothetical protein [Pseudorhodobacter sp.]